MTTTKRQTAKLATNLCKGTVLKMTKLGIRRFRKTDNSYYASDLQTMRFRLTRYEQDQVIAKRIAPFNNRLPLNSGSGSFNLDEVETVFKMCRDCKRMYRAGIVVEDETPFAATDIGEFCDGCEDCWKLNATKAEIRAEERRQGLAY